MTTEKILINLIDNHEQDVLIKQDVFKFISSFYCFSILMLLLLLL